MKLFKYVVFYLFLELYLIKLPYLIHLGEGDGGGVDVALPLGLFCLRSLFHLYLVWRLLIWTQMFPCSKAICQPFCSLSSLFIFLEGQTQKSCCNGGNSYLEGRGIVLCGTEIGYSWVNIGSGVYVKVLLNFLVY